jgi:hypothetical protein
MGKLHMIVKTLEEAIDLLPGDVSGWSLRDVQVSDGALLVSLRLAW